MKRPAWERNSTLIREECTNKASLSGSELFFTSASMINVILGIRTCETTWHCKKFEWMELQNYLRSGWHHDAYSFATFSSSYTPVDTNVNELWYVQTSSSQCKGLLPYQAAQPWLTKWAVTYWSGCTSSLPNHFYLCLAFYTQAKHKH